MTLSRGFADACVKAWNQDDVTRRRTMRDEGWTPDARYGHCVEPRGIPEGHGASVRLSWSLIPAAGTLVSRCTDLVRTHGAVA